MLSRKPRVTTKHIGPGRTANHQPLARVNNDGLPVNGAGGRSDETLQRPGSSLFQMDTGSIPPIHRSCAKTACWDFTKNHPKCDSQTQQFRVELYTTSESGGDGYAAAFCAEKVAGWITPGPSVTVESPRNVYNVPAPPSVCRVVNANGGDDLTEYTSFLGSNPPRVFVRHAGTPGGLTGTGVEIFCRTDQPTWC